MFVRSAFVTMIAFSLAVAPAHAQSRESSASVASPVRLAPTASPLFVPIDQQQLQRTLNVAQPAFAARHGQGFGLMIAGGALFVAGLLVGNDAGTAMAIGGAAIGAYGLYVYFR